MELLKHRRNSTQIGWLKKTRDWLYEYRPRFEDRRFWIVQAIILLIAASHDSMEIFGYFSRFEHAYSVPVALFFIPVVYAALHFGFKGSVATMIWIVLITIPNWVLWQPALERIAEMLQMLLLFGVANFVGRKVDREAIERARAEVASQTLKTYAAHVVNVQEDERRRIARELHDQTIQKVVYLGRQLEGLSSCAASSPLMSKQLQSALDANNQVVKDLRDFAKDLRPPALDDLGLVDSLSRLLLDFSDRTKIKSFLKLTGEEQRLSQETEVSLFRVVQEAIRNIELHSRATEVLVSVGFAPHGAEIKIKDNGSGFDVDSALKTLTGKNHFGLIVMKERVELSGGKLDIQSAPQIGTVITISIPVQPVTTAPQSN